MPTSHSRQWLPGTRKEESMIIVDMGIQKFQKAVDAMPDRHPELGQELEALGSGLFERFQLKGEKVDLDAVISTYEKSIRHSNNDPADDIARHLSFLGAAYSERWRRTKVTTDLGNSIAKCENSVDLTPEGHSQLLRRLQNVKNAYEVRYRMTGARSDLQLIDQVTQKMIDTVAEDRCASLAQKFEDLGIRGFQQYEMTGEMTDLDTSLRHSQEALKATAPANVKDRARRLQHVADVHRASYLRLHDVRDLDVSIRYGQESIDITAKEHPDQPRRLFNLGAGYSARYECSGVILDLENAIRNIQEAFNASKNLTKQVSCLEALAGLYSNRFSLTGAIGDLDIAIHQLKEVLDATASNHPRLTHRSSVLGAAYGIRYDETRNMPDLEASIQRCQQGVDATTNDDPEFGDRLVYLGQGYMSRYKATEASADIETCIKTFQKALNLMKNGHTDRAAPLAALRAAYQSRYEKAGDLADLDKSIRPFGDAAGARPRGHPLLASLWERLGFECWRRHKRLGAVSDLAMAIQSFQEVVDYLPSPTGFRLRSALYLLEIHAEALDCSLAHKAASSAVSLVPLLLTRHLENSDKQHFASQLVDLASNAAAIALTVGESPYRAIQALETCRGIILGSLSEDQIQLSDLKHKHPQLAEEHKTCRSKLHTLKPLGPQVVSYVPSNAVAQRNERYNTGKELERVTENIRKLPGFDRFLMGPSENDVKSIASEGPIVIVNVSIYRSDALLIETSRIRAIPLPGLNRLDVQQRAASLGAEAVDLQMLEWLWNTTTKPVLEALSYVDNPKDVWPRIWWMPTGPLAKLPIHAAGYHNGSLQTVMDRVISSYCSSITSFFHCRRTHDRSATQKPGTAVLVGMPEVPYALQEINELKDLCSSIPGLKVHQPPTTRNDVRPPYATRNVRSSTSRATDDRTG